MKELIATIAGHYYDTKMEPLPGFEHMHEWARGRYIEAIIDGLTDPQNWGD